MAGKLIVVVVAAGLTVACAEDPELDISVLEVSITEALLPAIIEGTLCPAPLPVEARQVACTGSIEGVVIEITVDIETDDDSATGPVAAVTVDAPLLDVDAVATEAGDRVSADLEVEATVNCPAPVVVIEPGKVLDCAVVDLGSGVTRPLTITLVDADGMWEMDLFP